LCTDALLIGYQDSRRSLSHRATVHLQGVPLIEDQQQALDILGFLLARLLRRPAKLATKPERGHSLVWLAAPQSG
jgi:hypothetical protein